MKRLLWLLGMLALAWCSSPAAQAREQCFYEVFCVDVRSSNSGADIYARTLHGDEVALGLTITRLDNATATPGMVATQTLTTTRLVRLLSVRQADPHKGWGWWYKQDWRFGRLGGTHDDGYLYELPWGDGQPHMINQGFFGTASHKDIHAVDIGMPIGTPVLAARPGVVIGIVDHWGEGGPNEPPFHENLVAVRHDDGSTAVYYHLLKGGIKVRRGQQVKTGQLLALSGNSGHTTGPHLHLEVFVLRPGAERVTVPFHFRIDNSGQGYELLQGQTYAPPGASTDDVEQGIRDVAGASSPAASSSPARTP